MTDKNRRPTRQNVRNNLDDLSKEAGANTPPVTEIKIHSVAIDLPAEDRIGDEDADADPDPSDVGTPVHSRYNPDTGEWETVDGGDA